MREYTIKKVNGTIDWDKAETANIDIYKWVDNDYRPRVTAKILYDDENIYVKQRAEETAIRAKHKTFNSNVCEDSCMEFFFRPGNDKKYMNFEVNAIGTMLIGLGEIREGRAAVQADVSIFDMKTTAKDEETYSDTAWEIEYKIPFSFLRTIYPDFDVKHGLYANMFKCGDSSRHRHYGMWNEVEVNAPDYHIPEFFGRMYFEE